MNLPNWKKVVIESISQLYNIDDDFNIESDSLYINSSLFWNWIIDSTIDVYKVLSSRILKNEFVDFDYTTQVVFINWKRYIVLEKNSVLNSVSKREIIDLLKDEFWNDLVSIWTFWSYITREDWLYSDYDLIIVLNWYNDNDIYEREKKSPELKRKLNKLWIRNLFAFNFYTREELNNASVNNPFLLETIGRSSAILYDNDNYLEKLLLQDRNIDYIGAFCWESEKFNTEITIERLIFLKSKLEFILKIAQENWSWIYDYYLFELVKINIMIKVLTEKNIFIWRFDFKKVFIDILGMSWQELNEHYELYRNSIIKWKKSILDYASVSDNINFSENLLREWLELPALLHRYLALKNILSELLHRSWNFITDWEFTQKFLQIFWWNIDEHIKDSFYNFVFKTEQILWRTWFLSFDLNPDWSYIFENWWFDYLSLIKEIDKLIKSFTDNKEKILNEVWEKQIKVIIITSWWNINTSEFIFPWNINIWHTQNFIPQDIDYVFILNSSNVFSPDYILKCLSWFNNPNIKVVSWNRVSRLQNWGNKYHNFVFRAQDYLNEWKTIFNRRIRNYWTEYFTS